MIQSAPSRFARKGCVTTAVAGLVLVLSGPIANAADPLASNNGLYPKDWPGRYHIANLDYPQPGDGASGGTLWPIGDTAGPLTVETAPAYAARLRAHLGETLRVLIEAPDDWDPASAGWYDMVWSGEAQPGDDGPDPTSGREALMNSYVGQIIPPETFAPPYQPTTFVQNHAVIYYNHAAATTLGQLWADLYAPDIATADFPDGAIVAKIEAVTNTPDNWDVLDGTGLWHVFRPSTEDQANGTRPLRPQVLPVRPFQMAIRVKDPVAAPQTGWVWAAFVHDASRAPDGDPWDRFVPVGLQWGNDPGRLPGSVLRESWINPDAPAFTHDSLGWGGRLAGPMDVATRHNVVTVSGQRYQGDHELRASSCQSCHGAAEHPFTANLYPAPNRSFPRDGQLFMMYDPGSPPWWRWFQNRPGHEGMSGQRGTRGLDYDMTLTSALSSWAAATGRVGLVRDHVDVH